MSVLTRSFPRLLVLLSAVAVPAILTAQQGPTALSLADALRLAERKSEAVRIAEAGVLRARGQQKQADSQRLPQLNSQVGYQRAIQNQFQAITERFASNDSSGNGGSNGGGSDSSRGDAFANSPLTRIFAAPNTATFTLSFSQTLYTAGRIPALRAGAESARAAAEIGHESSKAQAALDAAQAYFDAVAADRFLAIAESSLVLTERTLKQIEVARQIGSAAEFDLLRARVARDNQRPAVIQARTNRTTAYLRLKQLLDLPLAESLVLSTPIRDGAEVADEVGTTLRLADDRTLTPDTTVSARATVRQAEANVSAQEKALRAAQLSRLPSLQLSSLYQRFAYPPDGTFLPNAIDLYFPNWTVTLGLSMPILTGGRLKGERMVAEANLIEAQQRLQQTREGAALDAQLAVSQLEQSLASYRASLGTDEQAAKAYAIAEVRYREGLSTQVELTETRVQLEQARLTRVNAARDLELARLRLALLKDLPLSTGGAR